MPFHFSLRVPDVHFSKVLFWNNFEEETENTSSERCVIVLSLSVKKMDNVHFEVHELTIDGMLTWGMEVELDSLESGIWDMWVEKRDCLSSQEVWILSLSSSLGDVHKERISSLVEFYLFLFVVNFLVIEFESLVFEVFIDFLLGAQIDWSLEETKLTDFSTITSL